MMKIKGTDAELVQNQSDDPISPEALCQPLQFGSADMSHSSGVLYGIASFGSGTRMIQIEKTRGRLSSQS
jgi:hypothetical protein